MHYRRWRLYGDTGPASTTYGEGSYTPFGYRLISVNGKQRLEHRVIMEQVLGRPLRRDEEIHHKDGCPWNNDPSNLVALSRSEHHRVHSARPADSESAEYTGRAQRRPYYRWTSGGKRCASCLRFLPLSCFYRIGDHSTSYCHECHAVKIRQSRLKLGRASLTCLDCTKPISGYGLRCRSCAVKRHRLRLPERHCIDCSVTITRLKAYLRCRSCGRKALLKRRPDLIPSKHPDSGHFAAHG